MISPPPSPHRAEHSAALKAAAGKILDRVDAPAGVVLAVHDSAARTFHAGGTRDAAQVPLRVDDFFDIASVTKVMASTALILRLASVGSLSLDDPASRFLHWLGPQHQFTLRDLLAHRSGLWEWQPFYTRAASVAELHKQIANLPLRYPVGEGWHYSDLGFMLLGYVIEVVTGLELDQAYAELIATPLRLTSGYRSLLGDQAYVTSARDNAAERCMIATRVPYPIVLQDSFDGWRPGPIVGEVNDANAHHCAGGVSGHAGLFATAGDLLDFGRTFAVASQREALFAESIISEAFGEAREPVQALGFRREERMLRGEGVTVYWHPGFTGCAVGIVPAHGTAIALASNRLLARGRPAPTAELWNTLLGALGFEQHGKA